MIRAVLDTNTLVSAVINDVLHRPKVIKAHKLSSKELEKAVSEIADVSFVVPANTKIEVVRDPDDNKIISAAYEGQADYIISRDRDLLDLVEYQGIKIITPEEFMGILRKVNKP